jgi:serine/threonine protein kinase/WD40 repeat protein
MAVEPDTQAAAGDQRHDDREARLDAAIAAYHEAAENGPAPDLAGWIAGHSDLAPDLEEYFRAVGMLDALIDAAACDGSRGGTARIGPYRLVRVLGRGGMGVVYEVEVESTGRRFALKRLLLSFDEPRARERFQREIATIAGLDHPNIIPLHDAGEFEGLPYFVMPLIAGASLRTVLHEFRRVRAGTNGHGDPSPGPGTSSSPRFVVSLTEVPEDPIALDPSSGQAHWEAVARLGLQAARGLAHAHQHGVLHRDVKPSNLLLCRQGRVYLTDFGVARAAAHPDLTTTDELAGALRFIAPERFYRWCDPRSDIYSLGLVLYEFVTLRRAYDAPDRGRLIQAILHDDPPRPRRLDRSIPRGLETIVLKCIEKEPGHRYPSAEALACDLERFLAGKPPLSRRVGPLRRLWSWSRRHKARAAAGLIGSLMMVLLLASAFRMEQLRAEGALIAGRESRYRTTMLQLHQLRTGPHKNSWTDQAEVLIRDAVKLHGPDPAIQTQAAGTLQGLDAKRTHVFPDTGAGFVAFNQKSDCLLIGGATDPRDPSKPLPTQIWQVHTPAPVPTPVTASGPVGFRADGTPIQLAIAPDGQHLELLELNGGTALRRLDLPGPLAVDELHKPHRALAMTPDGLYIAATVVRPDGSKVVAVWEAATGKPRHQLAFAARCLAFSDDGSLLAGGAGDGKVTVWEVATGDVIETLDCGRTLLHALTFGAEPRRHRHSSPRPPGSGWLLAAASADGTIAVWDVASRNRLATCRGSYFEVLALAFSPDSTMIASAGRKASGLRIWEARTGQLLLECRVDAEFSAALAFSGDGRRLALASRGGRGTTGSVQVSNLDEGRGLMTLRGSGNRIVKVVVSPDSRLVAALGIDWTLAIWDASTGRLLHVLDVPRGLSADNAGLAFSGDGRMFAFSAGREAVLWDLDAHRELTSWSLPRGMNDALAFHGTDQLLSLRTESRDNVDPIGANSPLRSPPLLRLRNLLESEALKPVREIDVLSWIVGECHAAADGTTFQVLTIDTPDGARGRHLVIERSSGQVLSQRENRRGRLGPDLSERILAATGIDLHRIPARMLASSVLDAVAPDDRFVAWGNSDGTVTVCAVETLRDRLSQHGLDGASEPGTEINEARTDRRFFAPLRSVPLRTSFLILGAMILAHELWKELRVAKKALRARFHPQGSPTVPAQRRGVTTMIRSQLAVFTLAILAILADTGVPCRASLIYVSNYNGNTVDAVSPEGSRSVFATGVPFGASMVFDNAGNLYVANAASEDTIQKITPAGSVSTFATGLDGVTGLAYDAASNVFYAANFFSNTISRITSGGVVTPFASGGGLDHPQFLAFDALGNLYASNFFSISKITPTGVVSTFVSGLPPEGQGLAFDNQGNLFVALSGANSIDKITPGGAVSTFATGLDAPAGLAFGPDGFLYAADYGSNSLKRVAPDGTVSTFATGFDGPNGIVFQSVPEPRTLTLAAIGGLVMVMYAWSFRR